MRIAPHVIKPFTPQGCWDYGFEALKKLLFAFGFSLIGYGLGRSANCPRQTVDSLTKATRLCGVGFIALIIVVVAVWLVLKARRQAERDE